MVRQRCSILAFFKTVKRYGFFLLIFSFGVTTIEVLFLMILPFFFQLIFFVLEGIGFFYGVSMLKKYDWKDLFLLDAIIQKQTKAVKELCEQSLLIISAILLIFPGIFTDLAGLILLNPVIRKKINEILFYDHML